MIRSNYHIHSTYCDGRDSMEAMARAACASGLDHIGFSSHAPLKYPESDWTLARDRLDDYFANIAVLAEAYRPQMAVAKSLEVDYYLDDGGLSPEMEALVPQLDYWIGSIHCMGALADGREASIDYTMENMEAGIAHCFGGDVRRLVKAYYRGIADLALRYKPDILGHFDLIKKNNEEGCLFDEEADWYIKAWQEALDAIAESGVIVEINTGGLIRFGKRCLYPSWPMIEEIYRRHIPITVNGDSHSVEGIAYAYPQMAERLKAIGFQGIMILDGGEWHLSDF